MNHGEKGVAAPAEIAVDIKDKADHQAVQRVGFQIKGSSLRYLFISSEQSGEENPPEPAENGDKNSEGEGDGNAAPQAFFGAGKFPCPEILGGHGGHSGSQSDGGHHQKLDKLFHHSHAGRGGQPHTVDYFGDDKEGDADETVLQGDGCADF